MWCCLNLKHNNLFTPEMTSSYSTSLWINRINYLINKSLAYWRVDLLALVASNDVFLIILVHDQDMYTNLPSVMWKLVSLWNPSSIHLNNEETKIWFFTNMLSGNHFLVLKASCKASTSLVTIKYLLTIPSQQQNHETL